MLQSSSTHQSSLNFIPSDHISYEAESTVRQMIKPLEKIGGIHYFCYGVNYADTSGYTLHTNSKFYESWFKDEGTLFGFWLQDGWHIYDNLLPTKVSSVATSQDIGQFVIYIERRKDKTIIFGFGSRPDNKKSIDFYKDNANLLKRFGHYFANTLALDIIEQAENQLIKPPSKMTEEWKINTDPSLFDNQIKNNFPYKLLTEKEKCYLEYLLRGYSNNDIGTHMALSPKTISKHLLTLKKKLGCHNKAELFNKALIDGVIHYNFENPFFENGKSDKLTDDSLYLFLYEIYNPISKLADQEFRCYQLILQGCTLAEISSKLNIGIPTVADYLKRLKYKLGCMSRIELFGQAIDYGFINIKDEVGSQAS